MASLINFSKQSQAQLFQKHEVHTRWFFFLRRKRVEIKISGKYGDITRMVTMGPQATAIRFSSDQAMAFGYIGEATSWVHWNLEAMITET